MTEERAREILKGEIQPEERACVDCGLSVKEEEGARCFLCEVAYAGKMKEKGD